jgi:hypothetical protein
MKKTVKTTQYVWENESRLVVRRRQTETKHSYENEQDPIPVDETEESFTIDAYATTRGEKDEE